MRKIRLQIAELTVESFRPVEDGAAPAGTVQAHQAGVPTLETGYHGCYGCPAILSRVACARGAF